MSFIAAHLMTEGQIWSVMKQDHVPQSSAGLSEPCILSSFGIVFQHQLSLVDASSKSFASFILDAK